MASSMKNKSSSSKDHTYDSDRKKDTDTNSFLAEERRLLHSERRPLKKSIGNQVSSKSVTKFNTRVNKMTPEQVDEELQKRQLSINGDIDIRRNRLKQHHHAELLYGCANPSAMIEQHFEYIAVVDFEATCEENHPNTFQHEIIEFPIVLINVQEQTIVDKFQSYCRPIIKPILSKFCTELTGIKQRQVDSAPSFVEVLHNVEAWLNERNLLSSSSKRRLAFATDGPWDFAKFLQLQCHLASIPYPQWARKWINIRKEFASYYSVRRCGVNNMLGKLGLRFDGRPHSGLDDATNIARIAVELLKDGCILSLNDGIHASDPNFAALTEAKAELNNDDDDDENPIRFED